MGGGSGGGGSSSLPGVEGLEPIKPVVVSRGGFASSQGPGTPQERGGSRYANQLQPPSSSSSRSSSTGGGGSDGSKSGPCLARPGTNDPCAPPAPPSAWSEWSGGTVCSVTCGAGRRQLRRYCSSRHESDCSGESTREEPCHMPECNQWGTWSDWSRCTVTCGGGHRTRSRACRNGDEGGCPGEAEERQRCAEHDCPQWAGWGSWTECSATCGQGTRHRDRECGSKGGECREHGGSATETQMCELKPCPSWSSWLQWSDCSRTCGGGERTRRRECSGTDGDCSGPATEHMLCSTQQCPMWTQWAQWGPCSATCGDDGTRLRTRECRYEGRLSTECTGGSAQDQSACQLPPCPHWASWGSWSACSASCGHGQQLRSRECAPRWELIRQLIPLSLPSPPNTKFIPEALAAPAVTGRSASASWLSALTSRSGPSGAGVRSLVAGEPANDGGNA